MIPTEIADRADILAVVLFGSVARGDSDSFSDTDIFVMSSNLPVGELIALKQKCIHSFKGATISLYRLADVLRMAIAGSLFLWHLKLEGRILLSKGGVFEEAVRQLSHYAGYEKDLGIFKSILSDIDQTFQKSGELTEFDLGLLYTLARNTCMLLCMSNGTPKFGRKDVFLTARRLDPDPFPLDEATYEELFSWKMSYERGAGKPSALPSQCYCAMVLQKVSTLLDYGTERCI